MKIERFSYFLGIIMSLGINTLVACPFEITNDQNVECTLAGATRSVTIKPGEMQIIDPKHEGRNNALTVTIPGKKSFVLQQNLCATNDADKKITTSYIESLAQKKDPKNILEVIK